jgi:hypothetical protein
VPKAVGVLMREAIAIGRDDLTRRQRPRASAAQPTLDRITLGPFGSFPQHTVNTHLDLSGLPEMQMVPGGDLGWLARFVTALPLLVRLSPGFGLACLKQGSIFAWGSSFSRRGLWCGSIELAIAFEGHQGFHLKSLAGRSCRIPAICCFFGVEATLLVLAILCNGDCLFGLR